MASETRVTTVQDFLIWADASAAGNRVIYYYGNLAEDREALNATKIERKLLDELGQRASDLFDEGKVHLFQRRCGPCNFEYIAEKCPHPHKRRVAKEIDPHCGPVRDVRPRNVIAIEDFRQKAIASIPSSEEDLTGSGDGGTLLQIEQDGRAIDSLQAEILLSALATP